MIRLAVVCYELMIMRSEKDHTWEFDQSVIQCSNGLHIQMVGRLIQKQDIGTGDHHFGKKAANLLTTGKNTDTFLHRLLLGKAYVQGSLGHRLRP